jgi:preprotein translocase subunit YajC
MDATNIVIQVALILGVFAVLYLSLVRPQQRRLLQHRMVLASLRAGDRVATTGGLVGTVVGVDNEKMATVEIAENIRVTIIRDRIDEVLNKADWRETPSHSSDPNLSAARHTSG